MPMRQHSIQVTICKSIPLIYRSKYGLQHRALAHTQQQFIMGLKQENQRSNLYKERETRNIYEPHQQT